MQTNGCVAIAFFELSTSYEKVDWPDVQYRGIFINDEEELDAWAKAHTVDGTIGPCTYEKIYELLLRLKGNYIWPAMHVNCFNENTECKTCRSDGNYSGNISL